MSASMYGTTPGAGTGQAIFTDDVSLQVFMEHLKRLVCFTPHLSLDLITYDVADIDCRCPNKLICFFSSPELDVILVFCSSKSG
jgi:hypothetical protein